jgi:hypothetical protein
MGKNAFSIVSKSGYCSPVKKLAQLSTGPLLKIISMLILSTFKQTHQKFQKTASKLNWRFGKRR